MRGHFIWPRGHEELKLKVRGVTLNEPTDVVILASTGSALPGRGRRLATVHWEVADGQVTQPLLLQISISPLSFTDHAHRAPLAVLSMHTPTAVLPSMAKAELDGVMTIAATIAATATVMKAFRKMVREARKNIAFPSTK